MKITCIPGTQTVPSSCDLVMRLSLCQLSFPVQLLLPLCLSVYDREAKIDSGRHEQQAKPSSSSPRLFLTPRANNHIDAREPRGFKDTTQNQTPARNVTQVLSLQKSP